MLLNNVGEMRLKVPCAVNFLLEHEDLDFHGKSLGLLAKT